jgi:pimeloyl-ACP methyl ester carboxylesterase
MPLPITPVHPEGPRYRAPVVFVPGLWTDPTIWRRAAGLFAHRGWECWLVDSGRGGASTRAVALAEVAAALGRPPVVIAADAAGVVALEAARQAAMAALVWVGPVQPGGAALRRVVSPWRVLAGLLAGRPVGRPAAWAAEAAGAEWLRDEEEAAFVVDIMRGRMRVEAPGTPTSLVAGEEDRLCGAGDRAALAAALGAETMVLPAAGHWPLAIGRWQEHAGVVHRWLVRRLGETLLELYEEAMAERDDD